MRGPDEHEIERERALAQMNAADDEAGRLIQGAPRRAGAARIPPVERDYSLSAMYAGGATTREVTCRHRGPARDCVVCRLEQADRVRRVALDVIEGVVWRDDERGVEILDPGAVSTAALRRLAQALDS